MTNFDDFFKIRSQIGQIQEQLRGGNLPWAAETERDSVSDVEAYFAEALERIPKNLNKTQTVTILQLLREIITPVAEPSPVKPPNRFGTDKIECPKCGHKF